MGTPHLEKMSKSDIFEHWEGQQMLENAIREASRGGGVPLEALSSPKWVKNRGYPLFAPFLTLFGKSGVQ